MLENPFELENRMRSLNYARRVFRDTIEPIAAARVDDDDDDENSRLQLLLPHIILALPHHKL